MRIRKVRSVVLWPPVASVPPARQPPASRQPGQGSSMNAVAKGEAAFQARRRIRLIAATAGSALLLLCLAVSAWVSEAFPSALIAGAPRVGDYFHRLIPDLRWPVLFAGSGTEGSLAYWMYRLDSWAWLLFETSQIAALATLIGACLALVLCFPAAANLAPNRATYHLCRRLLELFRSVPDLVFALILVWTFGVGPLAGILAIALHTTGALGKLFAEVAENADLRLWDGVRAAGGSWAQAVRYAILPQVLPNFLSYALLRFEINVRGATVIGFVGAGGIGQELYTVISFSYYQEISAIVMLIVLAVSLIDLSSERLRHYAIGRAE
jgi:phosphonate transport system permease protein